jgi:hypothetical protein
MKSAILITLVLVIAGLVVGGTALTIQSSQSPTLSNNQTTSTLHGPRTQCSSTFPNGLQLITTNDTQTKLAFEVQPGTVDELCITYTINQDDLPLAAFAVTLSSVNATKVHGGYEWSFSPAPGVNITSNAAFLDVNQLNSSTTVTVVYTITVSSGAGGFYSLGYPNNCPALIPFAVTDNPQGVTFADFPGFFQPGSCELSAPLGVSVTGYTGMTTKWIGPTVS